MPDSCAHFIKVSDENGKKFKGFKLSDGTPEVGDTISAVVFFNDSDNGFGQPEGAFVVNLKKLGSGEYGA